MTDQVARFDRFAAGYAEWWAPVLAPGVDALLDMIAPVARDARDVIDVGTGTAQLALGALARWPSLSVVGADPSAEMCAVADAEADRRLAPAVRSRFRSVVAFADALPFEDGSFDLGLSSFVYQLVPSRARALREARRVLRPGGSLAYVSWLQDDRAFRADQVFDDVLDDFGIEPGIDDGRPGDVPSVDRAAGEMRRAGFSGVDAHAGLIEHGFSVDGYVAFLTEFDEQTLFEELEPAIRDRLVSELRQRLGKLSDDDRTMRFPIVFASGRRRD